MLLAIFGCQNHLLPPPTVPVTDSTENAAHAGSAETWGAPAGITATHGLKRSVQLSWQTVPAAVRYYIYEAATPYDEFVQIAETSGTQTSYTVTKDAGADSYYRVKAVSRTGELSPFSQTVRGTSLAQPVISDIIGDADNGDTSVIVYWYMNNVSEQTYLAQVQYTIICQDESGTEIARTAVSGAQTAKTEALFAGLTPNTSYKYKVEAFITSAQQDIEESAFMDAATARRLRPLAVTDLAASQGSVKDRVTLTFTLPDMVDTQDGEEFVQTPLYFMIYRREKAAEGAPAADFTDGLICAKFAKEDFGGGAYTPGQTVSYEDTNITRGVEYEYLVQSYSDTERPATSDRSAAQTAAPGWALSTPVFAVDTPQYVLSDTPNADGEPQYKSATVHMTFAFDPKGIDYTYVLCITIEHLSDSGTVSDTQAKEEELPLEALKDRTTEPIMLPNERGVYSYSVQIKHGEELLDTASFPQTFRITEETKPLVVENLTAADGYSNKIELRWTQHAGVGYKIQITEDASVQTGWKEADNIEPKQADSAETSWSYTHSIDAEAGKTYAVRVVPYKRTQTEAEVSGQERTLTNLKTLGIPELTAFSEPEDLYAYGHILLEWQPVQKADAYRVVYSYTDTDNLPGEYSGTQQTDLLKAADLERPNDGRYMYQFKPEGFDDARAAGRTVSVTLEAINTTRCADSAADASAITASQPQTRRQMGPGASQAKASQAESGSDITLTWNKTEGAQAYLIYRIQYDLKRKEILSDMSAPTAFRYEPQSNKTLGIGLQSMGGTWENADVSEIITIEDNGGTYTLTDTSINSAKIKNLDSLSYKPAFIQEQYDMPRGYPYTYIVIPVLNEGTTAEFDEDAKTCTIGGASYKNVQQAAADGYVLGLPQEVRASKGWGRTDNESSINDSIEITWKAPEQLPAGKALTYDIYRKEGSKDWELLKKDVPGETYHDTTAAPGIQYAYAVRTTTAGAESAKPQDHITVSGSTQYEGYMDAVLAQYEESIQGQRLYQGYMLAQPNVTSVSRDEQTRGGEYAETVNWSTEGLDSLPIAGYRIEVYNTNIDDQWHAVMDIKAENTGGAANGLSEQITNSYRVSGETAENLLKVLRDYKHYFRVRTYTTNEDGETIYSKEPEWTWTDGGENEYVKWGARQITAEEFARAALIGMSTGMYKVRGTEGSVVDGNDIEGLTSSSSFNWGPSDYTITLTYNSYNAMHAPRAAADTEVSSINVTGTLKARGGTMSAYQTHYWTEAPVSATYLGSDTTGTLSFLGEDSKNSSKVSRNDGIIEVTWKNETIQYDMAQADKPFTIPFAVSGGYLNDTDDWL